MKLRNYFIVFTLFLVLICSLTAVSAESDNATISELNDSDVSLSNVEESAAIENESTNVNVQEENNQITNSSSNSEDVSVAVSIPENPKASLKITTDSNFVANGKTYYMYLKDSKGTPVASKKLSLSFDGQTYKRTTDSTGKFGIKITSTKSSIALDVLFNGDKQYNAFSQTLQVCIAKITPITIGNSKLLTNGYLRIYLQGSKKAISGKTIKITIGQKKFIRNTTSEGFVVIKPKVTPKTYNIVAEYGRYSLSKKVKCIEGNVKDPLKTSVSTVNGVPDIDVMPSNYVMGYDNARYTLKKAQYQETIKRDSYCLFLYGKLSKYTFFKTKESPKIYHILKRVKWNVIERALNIKLVKKNKYSYWPKTITVALKGKSYTYSEVRDVQNTEYTCGPTSASVCSQALKKYRSEKFFQTKAHVTNGVNVDVLKKALNNNGFKASYYYAVDNGIKQLKKGGAALIAFLPNHYVSIIDVSKDGKKILVSNSYGKYNVGGASKVPTKWVSLKYFKSKFAGVGLVVKLNYKLSKQDKKIVKSYYNSMGTKFVRQNTNERIPNT